MALKSMKKKTTAVKTPAPEQKKKKAPVADSETSSKSWFMEGEDGFEKKTQLDHLSAMRKERMVPRFYLKAKAETNPETGAKSNEARVVFLDSKPFFLKEHNLMLDGRWGNMFTCTADFGPCPICESLGDRPTFTGYLTIIDTRKWPKKTPDKKTGATISEPRRMLFPAKGVAIDKIKELLEENKDIRGLVVDIKRMGDKDPNCGRDFSVKGTLSEAKLRDKFPDPETIKKYEYKTVLSPPGVDELKAAGIRVQVVAGSDEDIAQDSSDDDVSGLLDD